MDLRGAPAPPYELTLPRHRLIRFTPQPPSRTSPHFPRLATSTFINVRQILRTFRGSPGTTHRAGPAEPSSATRARPPTTDGATALATLVLQSAHLHACIFLHFSLYFLLATRHSVRFAPHNPSNPRPLSTFDFALCFFTFMIDNLDFALNTSWKR